MKIAVTSTGPTLESSVDSRFGRCPRFVIVETDDRSFRVVENSHAGAAGGAGIQSGQLVCDSGADVVLTGNCGPKAFRTLQAGGIEVVVGVSGTVLSAVEQYTQGQLAPADGANVASHAGQM